MEFPHASNNGLACVLINPHPEGWIFLGHFVQRDRQLVGISFRFWLNSHCHYWGRERHRFQNDCLGLLTQRIPGNGVLEAYHCTNVTSTYFLDVFTFVGMHSDQSRDTFPFPSRRVMDV